MVKCMDQRPYLIHLDYSANLMSITFDGLFWTETIAKQFVKDCMIAVASLATSGEHLILIDLRTAVLQSQVVYEKMKLLIGASTARRIALVATSPLARMQTKRLRLRDSIVLFATLEEARQWLFDAPAEQAA